MPSEQESSVKRWELDVVQKQVDNHDKTISGIDTKLDTILNLVQNRPTNEQIDDKISVMRLASERDLKDAIEKQDLKYKPIIDNNKWLLRLVVASSLGLITTLMVFAVGLYAR